MKETKFKQTEVGMIPSDWEVKFLSEIGSFSKGSGISRSESNSGNLPAIRYGEIYTKHNDYIKAFYSHISKEVANKSTRIYRGDVLFSASGETKEDIGKTVAFLESIEAYAGGDIIIMSPKCPVNSMFLGYILNFPAIAKQKAMKAQGDAVVHITTDSLRKLQVCIPKTTKEQQRIANALSDVDTLIANLEKLIAKKKNIKQGAMQQLLTGKKRLPGFAPAKPTYKQTELGKIPADWEMKKLSSVCTIIMGQSPDSKYYNEKEGTPLIQGNADIENRETFVRFYTTQITKKGLKGDLILTVRAPVGSVAKATFDCCLGRGVCALRNANDFLYQYLIYIEKEWAKRSAGSTFDSIKSDELSATLVVVPSSKEEQTAIANVLSDMDTEISALETKLAKYRTLKTGMMQQLLTGKVRLVDSAETASENQSKHSVPLSFKRSVLAAEIADRLCDEPTFGHVKMEKMLFLTEKMCNIDIDSSYHRDAAGPFDNRGLHSVDSQLAKQKWFKAVKQDKGYRYVPLEKRGGHKQYFERYFSDSLSVFNNIINIFKTANTEQCEIVATLYSAWEDFLKQGISPTDEQIVTEVLTNWHKSKERITKERWLKALLWMKEHKFIPNEN